MDGSLTDQAVLRSLLEEHLPDIHSHLVNLDVPIAVITLPWFLCLFIRVVPWDVRISLPHLLSVN